MRPSRPQPQALHIPDDLRHYRGVRTARYGASPPRFPDGIDVEESVRLLPPGATTKGMFLLDALRKVEDRAPRFDLFAAAGLEQHRILPFFDYPFSELMRLLVAAAEVLYPTLQVGDGVRRLGRSAYEAPLQARIGKLLFAVVGKDFARVASLGVRGWKISASFGKVRFESLGEGHAAYHFSDFPAFIDTYQVGVVEGAMSACRVDGEVWVKLDGPGDGTLEFFWG